MKSSARARMLLRLLLALATVTGLSVAVSAPAQAALTSECKTTSIACISFSGYAGKSVWGYPVNSTGNNCVNYAAYRLAKNGMSNPGSLGNGGSWADSARSKGFLVNHTPAIGSIAQWNYGSYYAPTSGHVGYVEEVTSTYIAISDSNWSGTSRRFTVSFGDPNFPSNFIHFRDQSYQPPPSGSFLRVRENGQVYRLVGTTPVYVYTWTAFGGSQPTYAISATTLPKLPTKIANGTFVQGAQTKEIYRMAGGAPIYVASFAHLGLTSTPAYWKVDQNAINHAGETGVWSYLAKVPATTTYIGALLADGSHPVYAVSAGAATWVPSWASVGGPKPSTLIDRDALVNAGRTGIWSHLLSVSPALG